MREYPRLFGAFRDADGRPPRHTFFYPMETYNPAHLDALAGLCRAGYGEVEVHLHHDGDTAEGLRGRLLAYKELLARRHGSAFQAIADGLGLCDRSVRRLIAHAVLLGHALVPAGNG